MMPTTTGIQVTLPGGLWLDGACHREAELRPLAGSDEAFLLEEGAALTPARRTTALLARCLTRLGPLTEVGFEAVRRLTTGDREALLLHLRRLTLGDRLQGVLTCPGPDCGEKLDLELQIPELLLPPSTREGQYFDTTVTDNGNGLRVHFRLPSGGDQEAAADLAGRDPQEAVALILRRCVESVQTPEGVNLPPEDWPPALRHRLPEVMAALDPQAELTLNLSCPGCGRAFTTLFDAGAYFFEELVARSRSLYREVHLLAFYYHWSEAEIMGMTARKRRRYLELLTEALDGGKRR